MIIRCVFAVLVFASAAIGQTTKPVKPIEHPHQILNVIEPKDRPRNDGDWSNATCQYVDEQLTAKTVGKSLETAAQFERYDTDTNTAFYLSKPIQWGGVEVTLRYEIQWPTSQAAAIRKLKPGARVRLEATIAEYAVSHDTVREKKAKRHADGTATEYREENVKVIVTVKATPAASMLAEKK